jgi:transposase
MKKYSAMGVDVSDKTMKAVGLNEAGEVEWREEVGCRESAVRKVFGLMDPCVVALETGTHTGWLSRLLGEMGHEVVVANARKVRAISANERKSDWVDAEILARLVRTDRKLLHPVRPRSVQSQEVMTLFKAREAAVQSRTSMVNTVRGLVKGSGERVRACSTEAFTKRCREDLKAETLKPLQPLLAGIEAMTEVIRAYDWKLQAKAKSEGYAQGVERVSQVTGVGNHIALAYMVTMESPERFPKARDAGAFLGMTPRRDQSGEIDKQLGITHAGNEMMRSLLVRAAHYIMGPFGPDCDLRRCGERLMARGGKNAKKRAIVAVARKLAVLMMRLWQTGEPYEPLRGSAGVKRAA